MVLFGFRTFAVEICMYRTHKERSTYNIAESSGNKIGDEELPDCDVGSLQHGQGNEKHICNAVFVAQGHKCHNRNLAGKEFLTETTSAQGKPNTEAYTPVGTDAFEKNHAE